MSIQDQLRRMDKSRWTLAAVIVGTAVYLLLTVNWQTALGYAVVVAISLAIAALWRRRHQPGS